MGVIAISQSTYAACEKTWNTTATDGSSCTTTQKDLFEQQNTIYVSGDGTKLSLENSPNLYYEFYPSASDPFPTALINMGGPLQTLTPGPISLIQPAVDISNTTNSTITAQNITAYKKLWDFLTPGPTFAPAAAATYNSYGIIIGGTNNKLNVTENLTILGTDIVAGTLIEINEKSSSVTIGKDFVAKQNYDDTMILNSGTLTVGGLLDAQSTEGSVLSSDGGTTKVGSSNLSATNGFAISTENSALAESSGNNTIKNTGTTNLIISRSGSTIRALGATQLNTTAASAIDSQNSTIELGKIQNSEILGTTSSLILQDGGSVSVSEITSSSSAGYLITSNAGKTTINTGSFTSGQNSILLNTAAGQASDITIGVLAMTNNTGESLSLNNAGTSTLVFNGSSFNSAGSLLKTSSSYSGTSTITLNSAILNRYDNLFSDTSSGSGTVNLNAIKTDLIGTTNTGGSALNLSLQGSSWTLNDPTNNQANLTNLSIDSASSIILADKPGAYSFTLNSNVNNAGLIKLSDNTEIGDILTITGDYVGNNGTVEFNTQLQGDDSATDMLVITGNVSGSTAIKINNINGTGSETLRGIQLIEANTSASNAFYLPGGYVSAGEYEYALSQQTNNGKSNWALGRAIDPTDPGQSLYSPNPGSMIALQQAGNTLFSSQLEDREGASTQWLTSDGEFNVWLRAYGSSNKYDSLSSQLHTKGRSIATQVGASLLTLGDDEQLSLGVMAGYGRFNSDTHSKRTERKSSSELDGYSVGAYATWYKDPSEKQSLYADSWLLWNHFDNTLKTSDGNKHKFKSKGITASVEVGSHYRLHEGEAISWWLQPQAQIEYQGVKADKYKDQLGVHIKSGKHNVQTRLGAKTYLEVPVAISEQTLYRPYVELNWLHNTNPNSIVINDNNYSAQGSRNQGEVKVGLEGNFSENGLVWVDTSYTSGSQSNRTVQGTLGIKYNF